MIIPERAPVRPRVLLADGGGALPLEDEIQALLDRRAIGAVNIRSPSGAGKTVALRHLAAVLCPADRLLILDEPVVGDIIENAHKRLFVYAGPMAPIAHLGEFQLSPWGRDDILEYLLSVHPSRCAAVMSRLAVADCTAFSGSPEIWRMVLDRMAGDASLLNVRAGFVRLIREELGSNELWTEAGSAALVMFQVEGGRSLPAKQFPGDLSATASRLVRYREVRMLLATEWIVARLRIDSECDFLKTRFEHELIESVGQVVQQDQAAQAKLLKLLRNHSGTDYRQPMIASILGAFNSGWKPHSKEPLILSGAYLGHAAWWNANLVGANLRGADLSFADLREANLDGAVADRANLRGASCKKASMNGFSAIGANLSLADMSEANCAGASFLQSDLQEASFCDSSLMKANLKDTKLTAARFWEANLQGAELQGSTLADADFNRADLSKAILDRLVLRLGKFGANRFVEASMYECDLEGMNLEECDFRSAGLRSALLTGCILRDANFERADLSNTGLADVDMEGANLRDADLRGASFHMGSTRSGKLITPIASEGTRTGFYTDDYDDQPFKAPEEIRKANLCRADLRGAKIHGVDFYLVDLRGALYDDEQAEIFKRSGAILEDRVE